MKVYSTWAQSNWHVYESKDSCFLVVKHKGADSISKNVLIGRDLCKTMLKEKNVDHISMDYASKEDNYLLYTILLQWDADNRKRAKNSFQEDYL